MKKRIMIGLLTILIIGAVGWITIWKSNTNPKSLEEDNNKTKLTVLIESEDYQNRNVWKGEYADKLYKATGISLSLTSVDVAAEKKLEQYMVSGTLPDIVVLHGINQMKVLMDAHLLLPLNDYENELQNIFGDSSYDEMIKDSCKYMSNQTGDLLVMPIPVHTETSCDAEYLPYLRFLPFTNAGAKEPQDLEDYLDIVEMMKEKSPYTITGHESYGFSISGEGDVYALNMVSELGYLYGFDINHVAPLMEVNIEEKTVHSIFSDNSFYKRALHFFFEANQRGLLDKDSRNQTRRSLNEKYESGSVMFCVEQNLIMSYWSEISGKYATEIKGDAYIPVLATNMSICRSKDGCQESDMYIAVNNVSINKDTVCKLLNWMYDTDSKNYMFCDDGNMYWDEGEYMDIYPWQNVMDSDSFIQKLDTISVYAGTQIQRIPPAPATLAGKMYKIGEQNLNYSWDMIFAENEEQFEMLWSQLSEAVSALGMDDVTTFYQNKYRAANN